MALMEVQLIARLRIVRDLTEACHAAAAKRRRHGAAGHTQSGERLRCTYEIGQWPWHYRLAPVPCHP
jgi:hypothetical protein